MPYRRPAFGTDHLHSRLLPMLTPEIWTKVSKKLRLTPRQAEVVYLVLQAKQHKQVAAELGLKTSTVRMHVRYVFKQLDVTDRMELALLIFHAICRECDIKPHSEQP